MSKFINLTGQKFGRLTVIKRAEDYISPNGKHEVQWLCECECGNNIIVPRGRLLNGSNKSCGCLQKELRSTNGKKGRKYNAYDLSGDYGIGYTSKGEEFYFDLEDYDKIKGYCWLINKNGYVISKENQIEVQMHRIIMNCPNDMVVDHKHGKKTRNDNRKNNLRIATRSNNACNHDIHKDNTSGVSGVNWNKKENKWIARISVNYKRINLGYFSNFEDAVKARKEAEEKYFGEWSYDNSTK